MKQNYHPLPCKFVQIEPLQLLFSVLNVLSRLHAHVKYRAVLVGADYFTMHGSLTPLALRPQPSKSYLHLVDFLQTLLVEFSETRPTVLTHSALALAFLRQRRLASHTCLRLLGKLHQSTDCGCSHRDRSCMVTRHWQKSARPLTKEQKNIRSCWAFRSPTTGSKIRPSGFASWLSR